MRYKMYLSPVILVLVLSCKGPTAESSRPAEPTKPAEPVQDSSNQISVKKPQQSLDPYAKAALSIGYLLKADAISWSEIDDKYKSVEQHIKSIDREYKTSYEKELPLALAEIKANKSVEVNRHVVTKGLQHVTVLTIGRLIDTLITGDLEHSKNVSKEIKNVFSAIEPTFKRRDDTIYGGKPTLLPETESTLAKLEAANSKPAIANVAMELSTLLSKTYVLSVLFEMKGVEEFCGTKTPDPDKCAVKRTEAGIYYRIIKEAVANRDKEADTKMEKMIGSEHGAPSYAKARDLLANVFPFTKEDLTF